MTFKHLAAVKHYFSLVLTLFTFSKAVVTGLASVLVSVAIVGWMLSSEPKLENLRYHPGTLVLPALEEPRVVINDDRFQLEGKTRITVAPLIFLLAKDRILYGALRGEWDERHARLERGNAAYPDHDSEYQVWLEFQWLAMEPFPVGKVLDPERAPNPFPHRPRQYIAELRFLADGHVIDGGEGPPMELPYWDKRGMPIGPYNAHIIGPELPLNRLEQITNAKQAEMRLGYLEITLDEKTMQAIREFTREALKIRREQMAKVKSVPPIPCK